MKINAVLDQLPPPWPCGLSSQIRDGLIQSNRTIVVLDDDPTGTQTVYDVPVLTRLDLSAIQSALVEAPPVLFLLTNSRSMTPAESKTFHVELTERIRAAASATQRDLELISRSDSTLRGHYPLETDVIADHWPGQAECLLLMPFFLEGGRITIDGQHFVQEQDQLIPAHQTPFAQDTVFGYRNSQLPLYVEEKTQGRVSADQVILIPLDVIRQQGPPGVEAILNDAPQGAVLVADGVVDEDAQVVAAAVANSSKRVLARVAASYVRARAGLENRALLSAADLDGTADRKDAGHGGLVVVGSQVPKTTAQLQCLLNSMPDCLPIELDVAQLLANREKTLSEVLKQVDAGLASGRNVVLFTSRELVSGDGDASNLQIASAVSSGLVHVVQRLSVRPRYLIAKGGITSSDIATEGLGVDRATVVGSLLPGVPVWKLGSGSRFPEMNYVVFPGNVGGDSALAEAVKKLI